MSSGKDQGKLNAIRDDVIKGEIKPVYLVSGTEDYLVYHARQTIIDSLKSKMNVDNVESVDPEKLSPADIVHKLKSPSLFNPFQILLAKNVPWFDAKNIARAEPFKNWLSTENPRSTIVISALSVDRRLGLVKQIGKKGALLKFDKVRSYDQGNIHKDVYYPVIASRLIQRNQSIDADAWQQLRRMTPDTLWDVINAVDVVSNHAGDSNRISAIDVEECIQDHTDMPGYLVLEAMGKRDPLAIRNCLEKNLAAGAHGLLLNKTVSNRIRALLAVHTLNLQATSLPRYFNAFQSGLLPKMMPLIESHPVGNKLLAHMKPYALFMLLQQSKGFKEQELAACLVRLEENDLAFKSGSVLTLARLEAALLPFCKKKGNR